MSGRAKTISATHFAAALLGCTMLAGLPGAAPKAGFDLGVVMLEVATTGPGHGTLVPATKVRMDEGGAIVTEDYGADVVRLTNVVGK